MAYTGYFLSRLIIEMVGKLMVHGFTQFKIASKNFQVSFHTLQLIIYNLREQLSQRVIFTDKTQFCKTVHRLKFTKYKKLERVKIHMELLKNCYIQIKQVFGWRQAIRSIFVQGILTARKNCGEILNHSPISRMTLILITLICNDMGHLVSVLRNLWIT